METINSYTAFLGPKRIASGALAQVALEAKIVIDDDAWAPVLIFNDETSEVTEVDFRGTPQDVAGRLARPEPVAEDHARKPGRPKLGVVAREVTLLPRHWDWLATQPGGASVALRKLVEHAKHENQGKDRLRKAQESAYRFLSTMAGNLPGFEEASRALFAGDRARFHKILADWPPDIGQHAGKLADIAFPAA